MGRVGKLLKPLDFVIVGAIILTCAAVFLFSSGGDGGGARVTVISDGRVVYEGSADVSRTIEIGGAIIVIGGGHAYFMSSPCKDQVCVKHGYAAPSSPAVCLPLKLVVKVSGETGVDVIL